MILKREPSNPIITAGKFDWRSVVTFNPGVIEHEGEIYLFERASGNLNPFVCSIGLLKSKDGINFEHVVDKPVLTAKMLGYEQGTVEDARLVKIDGKFIMTFAFRPYTYNCSPNGKGIPDYTPLKGELDVGINNTLSGIAVSENLIDWEYVCQVNDGSYDDRDVIMFPQKINGEYAILRRPKQLVGEEYGCNAPSIFISYSKDLKSWSDPVLFAKAEKGWEGEKIGGAAPPLLTDSGYIMFYHGVSEKSEYRVGAMLLDKNDPTKILARTKSFILEPEESYEREGVVIPNVVFPTGNLIVGDEIHLYYGCCDTSIALAKMKISDLLKEFE